MISDTVLETKRVSRATTYCKTGWNKILTWEPPFKGSEPSAAFSSAKAGQANDAERFVLKC